MRQKFNYKLVSLNETLFNIFEMFAEMKSAFNVTYIYTDRNAQFNVDCFYSMDLHANSFGIFKFICRDKNKA